MILVKPRPLHVLMVANSYYKVESLKDTLFDNKILHTIAVTLDVAETIDFLRSNNIPDIIVMDESEHKQIIATMEDETFKNIPIIVTTKEDNYKILEENRFFIKPPVTPAQLFDVMEKLPILYFIAVDEEEIIDDTNLYV